MRRKGRAMMKKGHWKAKNFTDTEWASAEDKAKFANALRAFVESGFAESKFTRELYSRLHSLFGFIAEYDKGGFWGRWFHSPAACWQWVEQVRRNTIYGDPAVTWSDVEREIQKWLNDATVHGPIEGRAKMQIEKEERAVLRSLLAKYPDEAVLPGGWSDV
jgi:hypothetical protein